MRPLAARCRMALGRLIERAGNSQGAVPLGAAATQMYREMGMED